MTVASYLTSTRTSLVNYVSLARPNHWFKNVFMIPGVVVAATLTETPINEYWLQLAVGIASASLIASANYVINEWLDAPFDRHHPTKRQRPAAEGRVKGVFVYMEYALLAAVGLTLAATVSSFFFMIAGAFLLAGVIYNVQPVRAKDRAYLDVIAESANNPIRLILGWTIVAGDSFPPSSLVFAFWAAGAFLMSVKRYSELRFILAEGGHNALGLYRRSFRFYDENGLLLLSFFYGFNTSFFLAVFLLKYRIEYVLTFPLFAGLFTWYMLIGLKPQSVAQTPELLYKEGRFLVYLALLVVLITVLTFIDLPTLDRLLENVITGS